MTPTEKPLRITNLLILDESGSMMSIKSFVLDAFAEIKKTINASFEASPDVEHYVGLVSFNSAGINNRIWQAPVQECPDLTHANYQPNHSTPLNDAMGFTLQRLRKELENVDRQNEVVVTILSDGLENASTEFSLEAVRALVDELTAQGWTFAYIGADHDVQEESGSRGIQNHMSFEKDRESMKLMSVRYNESLDRVLFSKKGGNYGSVKNFFQEEEEKKS